MATLALEAALILEMKGILAANEFLVHSVVFVIGRESLTLARAIGHSTFAQEVAQVREEHAVEMAQHFAANRVRQARGQGAPEHDRIVGVDGIS
jgi:hypothetical protein